MFIKNVIGSSKLPCCGCSSNGEHGHLFSLSTEFPASVFGPRRVTVCAVKHCTCTKILGGHVWVKNAFGEEDPDMRIVHLCAFHNSLDYIWLELKPEYDRITLAFADPAKTCQRFGFPLSSPRANQLAGLGTPNPRYPIAEHIRPSAKQTGVQLGNRLGSQQTGIKRAMTPTNTDPSLPPRRIGARARALAPPPLTNLPPIATRTDVSLPKAPPKLRGPLVAELPPLALDPLARALAGTSVGKLASAAGKPAVFDYLALLADIEKAK